MTKDYATEFKNIARKHLKLDGVVILDKNYLRIESPQLLAAFIGYLKFQHRDFGRIYFRGEKEKHSTTVPKLYRGYVTNEIIAIRTQAYEELVSSINPLFNVRRFKREDVNSILQHYGIKTNWIDLVDNLFIALWFSLFENSKNSGFIKIFCERNRNSSMKISDLREEHSSLSLRLHCQHGISATKPGIFWCLKNIDFDDFLVSKVEIPNSKSFELHGDMFKKEYMYPNKKIDNTLKLLSSEKMNDIITKIIKKYSLMQDDLGKIE